MPLDKKMIFIVDDDESVCRALKLLMGTYGFDATIFSSAEKFLKEVSHNNQGCLILDIHMPDIDGWETFQRLRVAGSNRPVIFISANKSGGLKERALREGALGFLQKPFNDQELVDLINLTH